MEYEAIIGLETHVELDTVTKVFCDCRVSTDAPPNTRICPVCTGQPGALPVLNRRAVEYSVKAGLALGCRINGRARFARKNYFYPDLPKGYQISQYEQPFCEDGALEITGDDGSPYAVGIRRIHLEEDAGKLVHVTGSDGEADRSLVDYNRSSVPLLEIVTDHQRNPMRSVAEARAYLQQLRQILRYIGVSQCLLERGQFRNDVNVSLRPRGSRSFGNRVEIKNMSSFRFIAEAIEHEIRRQAEVLDSGGRVDQETRLFDEAHRVTRAMRSKEDAPDYRYFPDPDLLDVRIGDDMIREIEASLPELPGAKLSRLIEEHGIARADALLLTRERSISEFFLACAESCRDRRRLGYWITKELFKLLKRASVPIQDSRITPEHFSQLVNLVSEGALTEAIARSVLEEMFETGSSPGAIIESRGLEPIDDVDRLAGMVDEVLEANPQAAEQARAGDERPLNFLVGQVMRASGGKAVPQRVRRLILSSIGR